MPSWVLTLRWLAVPMLLALSVSGMANEPFVDGDVTCQPQVMALDASKSAELFDAVVAINSLHDDTFELVIKTWPNFLKPLAPDWRLVAATDDPRDPLGKAESQLVESGLLTQVIAIDKDDEDNWRITLKRAELENVVEDGSLTMVAKIRVTSEEEDFPVEKLMGNAASAEGRWLPATMHGDPWQPCPSNATTFIQEKTLNFTPQASAKIRLQATLALKHDMTFKNGQLVEAQLEGRLCQGAEITPRFM